MQSYLSQVSLFTLASSESPYAVISEGCGVRVLLEDYNHLNGEGSLGYMFPAVTHESVTPEGTLTKFPCFPVRKKSAFAQKSTFSLGELYGCSVMQNATAAEELIFCARENSIVTLSGDIPPPGTVGRISDFLTTHLGRKVPCLGAGTGCERPEITRQPDWDHLGNQTFGDASGFATIHDWEKRRKVGHITSFGNGFSEGWCIPDLRSIDPAMGDSDVFPRAVLLKCPCFTSHERPDQRQVALRRSLEGSQHDSSISSTDDVQFADYTWPSFLWGGDWMSETINRPIFQAILRTLVDMTGRVSRSFVDLLYTFILLVIVLRTVIWWVEAM